MENGNTSTTPNTQAGQNSSLDEKILAALKKAGKDTDKINPDDLAPVDEFHIGGQVMTAHLMTYLQFREGMDILDIGCGIGGAARFAAQRMHCHVTGLDVNPDYCRVAENLTRRTGLADFIAYKQGDALALPFAAMTFDGAYSIHAAMNIADKQSLYQGIFRVLRPGALFGLYDVMAGPKAGAPDFPLPWASAPEQSSLATPQTIKDTLTQAGFEILVSDDLSATALFLLHKLKKYKGDFGPHIIIGDAYDTKIDNLIKGIKARCLAPGLIICRKRHGEDRG